MGFGEIGKEAAVELAEAMENKTCLEVLELNG